MLAGRRDGGPSLEGGRPPSSDAGVAGCLVDMLNLSPAHPGFGYFYLDFFPVLTLIWIRRK